MELPTVAVEIVERRGRRYYRFAGEEELYPSVTTALQVLNKPAIGPWLMKLAAESARAFLLEHAGEEVTGELAEAVAQAARSARSDTAADHGAAVHEAIHCSLQGLPYDVQYEPEVTAYRRWLEAEDLSPVATELPLLSRQLEAGGTIDVVAVDRGGRIVLVDWKTSAAVYPEYHYQLGAYALLWQEYTGQFPEGWCVRYGREDRVLEPVRVPDMRKAADIFLLAAKLFREHEAYARATRYAGA